MTFPGYFIPLKRGHRTVKWATGNPESDEWFEASPNAGEEIRICEPEEEDAKESTDKDNSVGISWGGGGRGGYRGHMVMERDLTWGGEHSTVSSTDRV